MVKLVLDDCDQISILENMLTVMNIEFDKISTQNHFPPLTPPFLLVNGVPLDFNRSLKWLKEQEQHE